MEVFWPKRCSNKIQKEETPAVARSFYFDFDSIILIIYFFVMKKKKWANFFFFVKFEFCGINVGCEKPVENHWSCGRKKNMKGKQQ